MTELSRRETLATSLALGLAASLPAAARAEPGIGAGAQWDLSDIYADEAAWDAARKRALAALPGLARYKGTLGQDAARLRAALTAISDLGREIYRIYTYAFLKRDEDLRVSANGEKFAQAVDLLTALGEATAWQSPEILTVGKARIEGFLAQDKGLDRFRFQLENTLRQADHVLSPEGEALLASASAALSGPREIRDQLNSADIPWPTVTLSTGKQAVLDDQGYVLNRDAPVREDRKAVMDAYFAKRMAFTKSIGAAYVAKLKGDIFTTRARKYRSSLEAALSDDNLPEGIYRTLVAECNAGLPVLHRYFALRQKMLKLPDMGYWDIYPPLVSTDRKYTLPEMRALTLEAVKPLGKDYVDTLASSTAARWMDPFPRTGKQSGAYMMPAAVDVHPYLMLNLGENFEGLSTFAHEWGHAMHTLLSVRAQPYETAFYATFIAEIASTCNEQLLAATMLAKARSRQEKLFILGQQLEGFRGTFFRQTMFAEFELAAHDKAEAGEGLSGDAFNTLYLDLLKRYHGAGVRLEPGYASEWTYISHFFRNFYVWQYATSITAATFFAESIMKGGAKARDNYLTLLRAGGSDYPHDLLKRAGLDMTTPQPYRTLVGKMSGIMDQIEALL
jgi:oligoendopeptidase F